MEDKNKHNIFSKEEFFRAIDEKKSLPPDADEFDKEALEGLSMVKDRQKLEKLDAAIDEIVHRESTKAGRRKNMYYFAAAASLALIIGIFFLVKENTLKKEDNLALSKPEKTEEVVTGANQPAEEAFKNAEAPADKKVSSGEVAEKAKEEPAKEAKLQEEEIAKSETFANDLTTVNTPATELENRVALNQKTNNPMSEGSGAAAGGKGEDTKAGGKSVDNLAMYDQEQQRAGKDLSKKAEEKKSVYKEADEKEKTRRYETNTVWTTPTTSGNTNVEDALKQRQSTPEMKPKVVADDRNANGDVVTTTSAPVQTQSVAGVVSKSDKNETQDKQGPGTRTDEIVTAETAVRGNSSGKHSKKGKIKANESAAPARQQDADKDVAGYSYYSQTSTREFTSPEFIGGTAALQQFISDNLEVSFPEKKGTVVTEFTVKPDGAVDTSSIKITQPIKDCDPCSNDVKRMVKKMPKWQPALENGKGKEYRQKMSVPYQSKQVKK